VNGVRHSDVVEAVRGIALGAVVPLAARSEAMELGLLDDEGLTDRGRRLVEDGVLRRRDQVTRSILRDAYMSVPALRAFLDGAWGRDIPRDQAEDVLRYAYPASRAWKAADFTRMLESLNFAGVVAFNLRRGLVRVLAASPSTSVPTGGTLVTPATPYRNKRLMADLMGFAMHRLWWFDSHLPREALSLLYDHAALGSLKEVRLLSAGRAELRPVALDDYQRLRAELGARNISVEWRCLLDKEDFTTKHDRWLLTDDRLWNVPPFTAVMQGKFGSLVLDMNAVPLADWWEAGTDMLEAAGRPTGTSA